MMRSSVRAMVNALREVAGSRPGRAFGKVAEGVGFGPTFRGRAAFPGLFGEPNSGGTINAGTKERQPGRSAAHAVGCRAVTIRPVCSRTRTVRGRARRG